MQSGYLDGWEGEADACELDADVVRAAVLHQEDLLSPGPHQLAHCLVLHDLHAAQHLLQPVLVTLSYHRPAAEAQEAILAGTTDVALTGAEFACGFFFGGQEGHIAEHAPCQGRPVSAWAEETTRALNHIQALTTLAMHVGASTPFLWGFISQAEVLGATKHGMQSTTAIEGGRSMSRLEEVFELVKVEVDARLVVARPHGALLRRPDLVPVQLLQPPPLLCARLDLDDSAHLPQSLRP